jgi:stage V sporulation protein G
MQPLAPAAAGTCRNITQQYFRSLSTCTAASVASDTHARKEWLQMEITDLKIRKMMTDGRLRAIVSITLDQMLAVHDIKVVQGESRLFVAMPSRKDEGGIFRDIVHPISAQARQYLEQQILDAYQEQLALMEAEAETAEAVEPAAEEASAPAAEAADPETT